MKTSAQLDADIAETLAQRSVSGVTVADVAAHIDATNPYRGTSRDAWAGIGHEFNDLSWSKGQVKVASLPAVAPASKKDVKRYATAAKKGSTIPAVVVAHSKNGYSILDGAHRIAAARALKLNTIDAFIGRKAR